MAAKEPPTVLPTSYICVDCQSESDRNDDHTRLNCFGHFICTRCLANRFQTCESKDDMRVCSVCYDIKFSRGIFIFVDDSNIWIGAKALQAKLKKFKTVEDHRVRIDIGRLTGVLADGREVEQGVLYGSEPPPVDTVWEKIKQQGWRVTKDKKHTLTGKEKKVDSRLVAEVTGLAIRTSKEERTTIVLVTGDADMIPAIQEIMKEAHWKVEVCMWKHAMSRDLNRFANANSGRVMIKHLDDCLDKVSFTNRRFNFSNASIRHLVNKGGVVFGLKKGSFKNDIPTETWLNQLESISQWPFQYYWFVDRRSGRTNDLVLVFRSDSKAGDFDIMQFLLDIKLEDESDDKKKQYRLPNIVNAETFLEYIRRVYKTPVDAKVQKFDDALEQLGLYSDEEVLAGSDNDFVFESDPRTWKTSRRTRFHRLRQQYSEPCPNKKNCRFGTRCQYQHSEDDKTYFKGRIEGRGNPVRKVNICKFFAKVPPSCTRLSKDCEYAHGYEDAWCLNCKNTGHFTDSCPEEQRAKSPF